MDHTSNKIACLKNFHSVRDQWTMNIFNNNYYIVQRNG